MESEFPSLPRSFARKETSVLSAAQSPAGGSTRSRKTSQAAKPSFEAGSTQTITVGQDCDIAISVADTQYPDTTFLYEVSRSRLSETCPYLQVFLHPNKFWEGQELEARLQQKALDATNNGAKTLPRIAITIDAVHIAKGVSQQTVVSDFLKVMTGHRISASASFPRIASSISLAESFSALHEFVSRIYSTPWEAKTGSLKETDEGRLRQKCLVLLLCGCDQHSYKAVASITKLLILNGSRRWSSGAEEDEDLMRSESALWWTLPLGVEEEICYRRSRILHTINDLQRHFLTAYGALPTNPPAPMQCRLGYSNSRACDLFQLGQIIRFLAQRSKTIDVFTSINAINPYETEAEDEDEQLYSLKHRSNDNIEEIIAALRTCPSYQIDEYHHHCGMRSRLVQALDRISRHLRVEAIVIWPEFWGQIGSYRSSRPRDEPEALLYNRIVQWRARFVPTGDTPPNALIASQLLGKQFFRRLEKGESTDWDNLRSDGV